MSHIFLAYSREDHAFARELIDRLEAQGLDLWHDVGDANIGDVWEDVIIRAIENCVALVVLMSPASERSRWVEREILLAERADIPIFPVLVEGEVFPRLRHLQALDAREGVSPTVVAPLVDALQARIGVTKRPEVDDHVAFPAPLAEARRSSFRWLWAFGTVLLVVLAVLIAATSLLSGGDDSDDEASVSGKTATAIVAANVQSATAFYATDSALSSMQTATMQHLLTLEASATAQAFAFQTQTAEAASTAAALPTPTNSPIQHPTLTGTAGAQTATEQAHQLQMQSTADAIRTQNALVTIQMTETYDAMTRATPTPASASQSDNGSAAPDGEALEATIVALLATESSYLSPAEAAEIVGLIREDDRDRDRTQTLLILLNVVVTLVGVSVIASLLLAARRGFGPSMRRAHAHPRAHPAPDTSGVQVEGFQAFISSSEADKPWVQEFVSALGRLGFEVWWYAKDAPGLPFGKEIKAAIFSTKVFIIVISPDSMASGHVEEEIRTADLYKRPIINVVYREVLPTDRYYGLAKGADIDFMDPTTYDDSLDYLAQAIDHHLGLAPRDEPAVDADAVPTSQDDA